MFMKNVIAVFICFFFLFQGLAISAEKAEKPEANINQNIEKEQTKVEGLKDFGRPKDPCAPYYQYKTIDNIPELTRKHLTQEQWAIIKNCLEPFDPPVRLPDEEL